MAFAVVDDRLLGNEENNTEYYDRGARHFRVALELDPNCHKAEFMLGVVDAMENHLDKAKEHFETAMKMSPQNPYYVIHYGILLKELGDVDGALREMESAETLDHSNPLTYLNLGLLESQLQKYGEARNQLETAVQLDSNLAAAYYGLGGVYHHLGLADLSRSAYQQFERAKALEQQEQTDPVEAAFSRPRIRVHRLRNSAKSGGRLSLLRGPCTIDRQGCSGDIGGTLGAEKDSKSTDIGGAREHSRRLLFF